MRINRDFLEFLTLMEGLELKAYKDSVGIWTIGIGSTRYEDGRPVLRGDIITEDRAFELFKNTIIQYEVAVNKLVTSNINQNQYHALLSFTYNLGVRAFKNSTLLKKVNKNPNDPDIEKEFLKWINANSKPLRGLLIRRQAEIKLYFK